MDEGHGAAKMTTLEQPSLTDPDLEPVIADRTHRYDLVIVGSGSAAFAAAITATEAGASVALMEASVVGGTCVNVGCVPSKAMLAAADALHRAAHHPFAGITTSAGGVDLGAVVDTKDSLVEQLRVDKYLDLAREYGFTICRGRAEFVDAETVECGGRRITAGSFLVATGATPWIPPISGLRDAGYLTSTTALELRAVPGELVVIGGNAVGLEMGQLFARLGSRVTIVEALPRIAPSEEPEASAALQAALVDEGVRVVTGVAVTSVRRDGDRRLITLERDGASETLAGDHVLVATGRRPNTADLGLGRAGIAVTDQGAIRVDDTLRTTNPRVWAAGDVTGHPQYVYVAGHEGALAARNAVTGADARVSFDGLPRVIFTSPTLAAAGVTEEQARARGVACEVRVLPMTAVPRAIVNHDTRGLVKIVAEAATGRILGASVVADGAGDVIQAAVYAIAFGLTVDQVANTWAPYLTVAEGLRLAAQTFRRDVSKLSCCAA